MTHTYIWIHTCVCPYIHMCVFVKLSGHVTWDDGVRIEEIRDQRVKNFLHIFWWRVDRSSQFFFGISDILTMAIGLSRGVSPPKNLWTKFVERGTEGRKFVDRRTEVGEIIVSFFTLGLLFSRCLDFWRQRSTRTGTDLSLLNREVPGKCRSVGSSRRWRRVSRSSD